MHREELVGIQTIWWVDYQLAVGFLTGSWKSNMDVWISNQLFGNPTACLSWPRCNGGLKHPLPPFATHILNRLDVSFHLEASKIYHTYTKN